MKRIGIALALGVFALIASAMSGKATEADLYYQCLVDSTSGSQVVGWCPVGSKYPLPVTVTALPTPVAVSQSGIWQVTPTVTTASVLTRPANATAYTSGQLIASSATAGSIVNPSFTMPALGGAIPRLRLYSNDTTSTAWANASVQIDLWDTAPTWTNGDHGTWLPATGTGHHLAAFTCVFPSAVWGDGIETNCSINVGNYLSTVATTIYWSAEALGGSGVLSASAATLTLKAEVN